jgi:hypothetical protein
MTAITGVSWNMTTVGEIPSSDPAGREVDLRLPGTATGLTDESTTTRKDDFPIPTMLNTKTGMLVVDLILQRQLRMSSTDTDAILGMIAHGTSTTAIVGEKASGMEKQHRTLTTIIHPPTVGGMIATLPPMTQGIWRDTHLMIFNTEVGDMRTSMIAADRLTSMIAVDRCMSMIAAGRSTAMIAAGRYMSMIAAGRYMSMIAAGRCTTMIAAGRCTTMIAAGRSATTIAAGGMMNDPMTDLLVTNSDHIAIAIDPVTVQEITDPTVKNLARWTGSEGCTGVAVAGLRTTVGK